MLAWRALDYGPYRDVLELQTQPDPTAPKGGVVVEVAAAGVNFFDILSVAGTYQVKLPPPFTPGTEAAGTVIEVGEGSRMSVGDRVIASNIMGGFAQRMIVPDTGCFSIPEGLSDPQAAALLINYQTSYFALRYRAALQSGETLLVHGGAGGVGVAAIQLGKAMGATVIATAGSPQKLEVCTQAGADHVINYRDGDFVDAVKTLTRKRGADVIYDPVGGDVFDRSTKCIAWGGRLVVIGFAGGRIPEIKANRILLKNIAIVGLNWGSYRLQDPAKILEAHQALGEMIQAGTIAPVVFGEFGLEDLPDAMDALAQRRSHGKVVLHVAT
ncbi:MAG: NADPH:quinone oxidoreductase family protein [Deltaproteobacteria bacterium]|nr:NADPH:quinone oxidoreductase family protein [Deltaproteobacteria bacterium]